MTVQQYLAKKRSEDPYYNKYPSDIDLYNALKGVDSDLPSWSTVDSMYSNKSEGNNPFEQKPDLGFIGSLALGDWGMVDENSANWVKAAYNNSITGMAYHLATGKAQFEYDEGWHAGIMEDIGSMVLSFAMPLDLASMFVGGQFAKAGLAGRAATKSVQSTAVKNLVKTGMKKQQAKKFVKDTLNNKLSTGFLFPKTKAKARITELASPKFAGAVGNASTLAVFEGVHGALGAAVAGEDAMGIMKAAGKGVIHGSIMGGVSGFIGASMGVKHASLLAKAAEKTKVETVTKGMAGKIADKFSKEGAERALFGAPGQIAAEGLGFTYLDPMNIHRVITDDTFTMKDLGRQAIVNMGMMGVLKAKSKVLKEGGTHALDFVKEQMKGTEFQKQMTDMYENIIDKAQEHSDSSLDKNNEIASSKVTKVVQDYLDKQLQKFEVDGKTLELKDIIETEQTIKKLLEQVEKFDTKDEIPPEKIHADDLIEMINAIHTIKGTLEANIGKQKLDVGIKKEQIKRLENIVDTFENDILAPLNKKRNFKPDKPTTSAEKSNYKSKLNTFINESIIEGDLNKINLLLEGNENAINVKFTKGKGKKRRVEKIEIDEQSVRWDNLRDKLDAHIPAKSKLRTSKTGIGQVTDSASEISISIKDKNQKLLSGKINEGDPSDTRSTYKEKIRLAEQRRLNAKTEAE